jgi:Short C-terminal domain
MPGLVRGIARTAVIAGTATAVSNGVSRRQGQRWAAQGQQQPQQTYQQQPVYQQPVYAPPAPVAPAPAAPAPPPAPAPVDRIAVLKELAGLRDQGILTEAEFATEKAKILAG